MTTLPPPLDQLGERETELLGNLLEPVEFAENECIFAEGSAGDCCYIIDGGRVRVQLDREHVDSEAVLAHLTSGAILGELSLLDGQPRSASAYAETVVQARRIDAAVIDGQRDSHPLLYASLMAVLGRAAATKLRATSSALAEAISTATDPAVDATVAAAMSAQQAFADWPDPGVEGILEEMASAVAARAAEFARATVERTRIGNVADKTMKNTMASVGIWRSIAGRPAHGILGTDPDRKVTDVASPAGVIFALIPVTNPIATAIFKTLIAIKARNALILSFHRSTSGLGDEFVELMRGIIDRHGAPPDLIQMVRQRGSRRTTAQYMRHPGVSLILATGGASMVKAAYSSGTPAIGVGPGNAPTLIAADADLDHAGRAIVESKSFDNGLICGSEHNLVVVREVADRFRDALAAAGAAILSPEEAENFVRAGTDPKTGHIHYRTIGRSAADIAAALGITRDYPIRVIVVPCDDVSPDNPMAKEKMAPVLSFFTARDEEEGIEICRALLDIEGTGHTAIIHTRDAALARRFGAAVPASRILVNSPGAQGVIGYTTGLVPSLTLGCGTFGGNSTSDNVSYLHLLNVKRVAEFIPPGFDLQAPPPE
jgi:acyl-CoA reductase-like NAD-dependent aldehyde dehydrogenase